MNNKCNTCVRLNKQNNVCPLLNILVNPKEHTCPMYAKESTFCDICGKEYIGNAVILTEIKNDVYLAACGQCASLSGTCYTCAQVDCAFQEDKTMPNMIRQRIQQGNAIFEGAVKNPSKIVKFCTSCQCFDSEKNACRRESAGFCLENYKLRPPR
jgi:hypothetical protein